LKVKVPASYFFHCGGKLRLLLIGLFSRLEETHVSLQRKPSMLEAAAASTLFSSVTCVSFGKECFLRLWFFKVEIGCLFDIGPFI
jgi:hypothetical protein